MSVDRANNGTDRDGHRSTFQEPVVVPSESFDQPFEPVGGVPFCVCCAAHVVTEERDIAILERCDSLRTKGSILVALNDGDAAAAAAADLQQSVDLLSHRQQHNDVTVHSRSHPKAQSHDESIEMQLPDRSPSRSRFLVDEKKEQEPDDPPRTLALDKPTPPSAVLPMPVAPSLQSPVGTVVPRSSSSSSATPAHRRLPQSSTVSSLTQQNNMGTNANGTDTAPDTAAVDKPAFPHSTPKDVHIDRSNSSSDTDLDVLGEYSVRREIATKVLGSKMLQGYKLTETACAKCSMPLMQDNGSVTCVVCPALVKKAKKKIKEQKRIAAEQQQIQQQKERIEREIELARQHSYPSKNQPSTGSSAAPVSQQAPAPAPAPAPASSTAASRQAKEEERIAFLESEEQRLLAEAQAELEQIQGMMPSSSDKNASVSAPATQSDVVNATNNDSHVDDSTSIDDSTFVDEAKRRASEEERRAEESRLLEETRRLERMEHARTSRSPRTTSRDALFKAEMAHRKAEQDKIDAVQELEAIRRSAQSDAFLEADAARAEEESRLIAKLEAEAEEKARMAEEALAQAQAALNNVSSARKDIIASTIAEAEREAVHEAEDFIRAVREDYKQPAIEPSPTQVERETWEVLRAEGRAVMTRRIIAGWRPLAEFCLGSECEGCALLEKDDRRECVVCGGTGTGEDGVYADSMPDVLASRSSADVTDELTLSKLDMNDVRVLDGIHVRPVAVVSTSAAVESATDKGDKPNVAKPTASAEPILQPSHGKHSGSCESAASATSTDSICKDYSTGLGVDESLFRTVDSVKDEHEDFEMKRRMVSKEMSKRLAEGWLLLDASCAICDMPLMADSFGNDEVCILCPMLKKVAKKKQKSSADTLATSDDTAPKLTAEAPVAVSIGADIDDAKDDGSHDIPQIQQSFSKDFVEVVHQTSFGSVDSSHQISPPDAPTRDGISAIAPSADDLLSTLERLIRQQKQQQGNDPETASRTTSRSDPPAMSDIAMLMQRRQPVEPEDGEELNRRGSIQDIDASSTVSETDATRPDGSAEAEADAQTESCDANDFDNDHDNHVGVDGSIQDSKATEVEETVGAASTKDMVEIARDQDQHIAEVPSTHSSKSAHATEENASVVSANVATVATVVAASALTDAAARVQADVSEPAPVTATRFSFEEVDSVEPIVRAASSIDANSNVALSEAGEIEPNGSFVDVPGTSSTSVPDTDRSVKTSTSSVHVEDNTTDARSSMSVPDTDRSVKTSTGSVHVEDSRSDARSVPALSIQVTECESGVITVDEVSTGVPTKAEMTEGFFASKYGDQALELLENGNVDAVQDLAESFVATQFGDHLSSPTSSKEFAADIVVRVAARAYQLKMKSLPSVPSQDNTIGHNSDVPTQRRTPTGPRRPRMTPESMMKPRRRSSAVRTKNQKSSGSPKHDDQQSQSTGAGEATDQQHKSVTATLSTVESVPAVAVTAKPVSGLPPKNPNSSRKMIRSGSPGAPMRKLSPRRRSPRNSIGSGSSSSNNNNRVVVVGGPGEHDGDGSSSRHDYYDDDEVSRAETVTSQALESIMTRIETAKESLLDPNADAREQADTARLIEQLASAAIAMKKLESSF